jgi:hypothetical protein
MKYPCEIASIGVDPNGIFILLEDEYGGSLKIHIDAYIIRALNKLLKINVDF